MRNKIRSSRFRMTNRRSRSKSIWAQQPAREDSKRSWKRFIVPVFPQLSFDMFLKINKEIKNV